MRLVKRLIELAFVILIISLFMKNKDLELQISYYGLSVPLKVAFWELVTFCVSIGIIIAALGDFITQLRWIREKRRMVKTDREHLGEVKKLNDKIQTLDAENQLLKNNLERKTKEASELQEKMDTLCSSGLQEIKSDHDKPPGTVEAK